MKKIISLLLIIASVFSCFMLTVSAEEGVITDEAYLPFEDVKENHWFFEAVKFCYANEIIKGMNEYTFGWNGNLTRAQFLLMLAAIDGADLTQYQVTQFEDVKENHWYYGAVAWAYENQITNGVSETKFAPNNAVTRSQIARMMTIYMTDRYSVEVNEDCLDVFNDAGKIRDWAVEGMKYVVSAGLISGMEIDGKLCVDPDGTTTRAQAAVIFKNFMEMYFYGGCEHSFSEATCTVAPVCTECGMVNGLPNGHRVAEYNCTTPTFCLVCESGVAASKIFHNFSDADCTSPRTCTLCGTTRGEAKGHKWNAATCTVPKTCTVCNATEGAALGHNGLNGICKYCGGEFFSSAYDKAIYYIKRNGSYDAANNAYTVRTVGEYGGTILSYYEEEKMFAINNLYFYDSGYLDVTQLQLRRGYTVYDYYYMQGDDTDYIFAGFGRLDATTFSRTTKESFSSYDGNYQSYFTDNLNEALQEMLGDASSLLEQYCKVSLKDFGFKVF